MACTQCGSDMEMMLTFHNEVFYYESLYCTVCNFWCTEKIYEDGIAEILWGRM